MTFTIHTPQVIFLVLNSLGVFIHVAKHDEVRTDKYNGVTAAIAMTIEVALLYWGGFFR